MEIRVTIKDLCDHDVVLDNNGVMLHLNDDEDEEMIDIISGVHSVEYLAYNTPIKLGQDNFCQISGVTYRMYTLTKFSLGI